MGRKETEGFFVRFAAVRLSLEPDVPWINGICGKTAMS